MNISIEISLQSLPKREVLLVADIANSDPQDFYFNGYRFLSKFVGLFLVNNTEFTRGSSLHAWQSCGSLGYTCPPDGDRTRIPALSYFTKTINIISLCWFLSREPQGQEHWLKFKQNPLVLYNAEGSRVGALVIPPIELSFTLIEDEISTVDIVVPHPIEEGSHDYEAIGSKEANCAGALSPSVG